MFLLITAGIWLASIVVLIVVILIIPSRKGTLRTTRSIVLQRISLADAHAAMSARLEACGFQIALAEPNKIHAAKPKGQRSGEEADVLTNAQKPLKAEVTLEQDGAGVSIECVMWTPDFILLDTGEGRQIDLTLERVLVADHDAEQMPLVSSPSLMACWAVSTGFVICAAALILLRPGLGQNLPSSLLWGICIAWLFSLQLVFSAFRSIRAKPAEVHGAGIAVVGVVVSTAGLALAWYLFLQHYDLASLL